MKKILLLCIVALFSIGCSKEASLVLDSHEEKLRRLETYSITSNATEATYSSRNPYVAKVDKNTGEVVAQHIGETVIDISAKEGTAAIKIIVEPRYNVITDPIIDWTASVMDVAAYEYGKKDGRIEYRDDNTLDYVYGNVRDGDSHIATSYNFENDRLKSVLVLINKEYLEDVKKHLEERWEFYLQQDGKYLFCDALEPQNVKTSVVLMKYSGQWIISYIPN